MLVHWNEYLKQVASEHLAHISSTVRSLLWNGNDIFQWIEKKEKDKYLISFIFVCVFDHRFSMGMRCERPSYYFCWLYHKMYTNVVLNTHVTFDSVNSIQLNWICFYFDSIFVVVLPKIGHVLLKYLGNTISINIVLSGCQLLIGAFFFLDVCKFNQIYS